MTFYQELQLNPAGSKNYIASFQDPGEKWKHIGIFLFKIALVNAFSILFILLSSILFGAENSIAGLVVLLCIQMFRFSDLGIRTSHGVWGIMSIFGIFAIGPKLSNMLPAGWAFCVDFACIFMIVLIGCHNVKMCNHSILVLSYLLLQGSDVSGRAYAMRIAALLAGGAATALVLYRNHREVSCGCSFKDIFREFDLNTERTRWQVRFAIGVSSVMLASALLGIRKPVWAGIAAMSVLSPFRDDIAQRVKLRAPANVLGSLIFLALYAFLPENMHAYLGMLGGIALGFSATYAWQAVFNSIGVLAASAAVFGVPYAIFYRIFNNAFGSVYAWLIDHAFDRVCSLCGARGCLDSKA